MCDEGLVYRTGEPPRKHYCSLPDKDVTTIHEVKVEGCFCPDGMVQDCKFVSGYSIIGIPPWILNTVVSRCSSWNKKLGRGTCPGHMSKGHMSRRTHVRMWILISCKLFFYKFLNFLAKSTDTVPYSLTLGRPGGGWVPPPLAFFPCNFFDDSNGENRLIVSVTRDGRHILAYVTSSWRCHVTYVMTSYVHDGGQNTLFLQLLVNRDNFWCICDKVMRLVSFSTKLRL